MDTNKPMTLGVIVGNRGFFPDHLARSGREEMLAVLSTAGVRAIAPGPEETKHGAVETRAESRMCADLFRRHRDEIDGILVTLPNFGEERGIADALRMAGLDVPGEGHLPIYQRPVFWAGVIAVAFVTLNVIFW